MNKKRRKPDNRRTSYIIRINGEDKVSRDSLRQARDYIKTLNTFNSMRVEVIKKDVLETIIDHYKVELKPVLTLDELTIDL